MILDVVVDFVLLRPHEPFDFNRFFALWGPSNLRWQDNYGFTTVERSHDPIVPRLLKVLERYSDEVGIASIINDFPLWRWKKGLEQIGWWCRE